MCRKLFFLTSFLLVMGLAFANVASAYVLEVGIATNDDDVEERFDSGSTLDMGSSDVEMPYEDTGMGDPQVIGLRYPGVSIPKGSTIVSAYVQFQIDEDKGGTEPVSLVIDGELAGDAAAFVNEAFNVTSRTRTAAQVLWSDVPNWTNVGDRGPDQATPDIASIIQEIIDQEAWASGNPIVLIISDDPANPSSGIRCAEAGPGDDSATLIIEFTSPVSFAPIPADGAIEVDTITLEWSSASTAVSHNVYLSTDEIIEESELAAETQMGLVALTLDPGVTYYWRVDDVDADGVVTEGTVWSLATLAIEAHFPSPADADTWISLDTQLSWTAGKNAIMHDVYFGTDEAAVAAADPSTFKGKLMDTSFGPGALEQNTTYYWKVDEFALGVTNPGPVWSFSTLDNEIAVDPDPADGAEGVADSVTLSWSAGAAAATYDVYISTDANALGDAVAVAEAAFTPAATLDWDTTYYWKVDVNDTDGVIHPAREVWSFTVADYIIIDDSQTTLEYDNSADPFVTEAMWDTPADLTINGVRNLSFQFQGSPPPAPPEGSVSLDMDTGTYSITGSGADVWGSSDQFHLGYRELTGDAVIVARVVSYGEGSNAWAKGGVMIRQSLDAGSTHSIMALTGGNGGGAGFQFRPVADGESSSFHDPVPAIAPPYWVRLDRVGNVLTGYHSPDGETWTQQGEAQTIEMTDPVLIGLFVTSHAAGETRTYEFDNVGIDGDVSADDTSTDVGIGEAGNAPAPIYAALEDSTGAVAMVTHPNPAATNIDSLWKCTIPVTDFDGVDLTDVAKLYIGVGDGEPGGSGSIDIMKIRVTKPVVIMEPGDISMPGDNVKGVPDDGDWPGGEYPALAIDDDTSTKFLHFKGEVEPTGIKVTPSAKQVVTGLAFTTANDAVERDPVAFELYGSNDGIDGAYELIASGDIVDFNDPNTAWPRFTTNATPISFDNDMVYDHYQILFPTVRDAASANSMQIAEIELITDFPVLNNGDTLDGLDHNNSVDKWDGSAPGAGNPGGLAALTEDDVDYIRLQDTGDPRDYGSTTPTGKTNYSLYLTQAINNGLDGARLEFRARVATSGTLDAWRKDGGGMASTGLTSWPSGGRGGSFDNYGRGNIGIAENGKGVISFSLSTSGLMVGKSGNKVSVDDAAQWNTFVIKIAANDNGKYTVSVSANGKLAKSFEVSAGSGVVESGNYIAIGSPDLAGRVATAFDVDYISVTK